MYISSKIGEFNMTIFDTDDLSDLPENLIKELKMVGNFDLTLLELFNEAGGTLNLTTLLVGYYRKHKDVKPRKYMMTMCYRLVKKGLLEPTKKRGEYRIARKGKSAIGEKIQN